MKARGGGEESEYFRIRICDGWGKVKGDGEEGNDGSKSGEELECDERRGRRKTSEPHSSELNLRS